MEFIDLENTNTQENNTMQKQEPTLQETINNQTCGKPIKPQIEPIMTDRNSIRAETLINLTAHFYKLFKDKGVINRFEPFLKDCKEQAMQRININEMLVFKDLEVPDSDFDSGMGNTESEVLPPNTEAELNKENTESGTTDETQGSDVIVDTETELKPV